MKILTKRYSIIYLVCLIQLILCQNPQIAHQDNQRPNNGEQPYISNIPQQHNIDSIQQHTDSNTEHIPQQPTGIPMSQTSNFGYQADGSMDLTAAKAAQQKKQFIDNAGRVQAGTTYIQQMFQNDGDDDFSFTLPVQQQISLYAYAYVSQDNTFVRIKNVTQEPPVRFAIYQNQYNIIVRQNFYFQKFIVFNGKKDHKYTLKFQTAGKTKLISLSLKLFVQTADISKTLQKGTAMKFSSQTKSIRAQLNDLATGFGVYWLLDLNNVKHTAHQTRRYYFWQLLQMIVFALAAYIQVQTIFKLFKGNSIIV